MRPSARSAFLMLLVVASALTAGCSVKDWFNQSGKIHVNILPLGPEGTDLLDFRSVKVALYSATVKQVLIIEPKDFSYGDSPLIFDMVEKGTKGEKIPILSETINIRAVESITLRLDVVEAIDAQGRAMPICREGETITTFPCFFVPEEGVYRHQNAQTFSTVRGGSVTFNYPLGVRSTTQGGNVEYFIYEDPAKVVIETSR